MWTSQAKTAIAAVVITCLVLLMVDDSFSPINETVFKVDTSQYHSYSETPESIEVVNETGEGRNRTGILFDTCVLNELDPWDATINRYFHYGFDPLKNCKRTVKEATKLEDGKLYVLDGRSNIQCWWRCLLPKDDYNYEAKPWNKLTNGSVPECDIVETNCRENVLKSDDEMKKAKKGDSKYKEKTYYEFLHAQAYRNTTSESAEKPKEVKKPDVHIILFDSVSESQFIRSMPKTRHYLREYYDAVSFRYLNKIGVNSRPNGLALLMGKALYPIKQSPMSVGYESDFVNKSDCNKGLDSEQFISFQYQEAGYKTLMSEDWALGVFNWPSCKGFKDTPVDHYMRPYQLRVEGNKYKTNLLRKSIYKGVCRDSYAPQMEYLQDLLEKFPDTPKFTITWMSYVAHDDINGLFHADDYFYNFFKDNNPKLNNSYMFIMGDHGMRFGQVRKTSVGEREDNNPFLFMALPGSLRGDNELLATVRNNAHQLISHYDLYATFADIVAPHRPQNSKKVILRGSSVFKPLPQPRTCDRLRIPFEYCICENKKKQIANDAAPGREAATLMVEKMNKVIQTDQNLKDRCAKLSLSNVSVVVEQFQFEGNLTIYQVTYKVLPGNGQFWGYIGQNVKTTELKVLSDRFPRLDSYDKTAFCAKKSSFAGYCYCKSLLPSSTTTTTTTTASPIKKTTVKNIENSTGAIPLNASTTGDLVTTNSL
uniref:Sulfatase N-terminal domain-containing protein n=1 Tax=Panagrellus redivivus TaxID=6233 RepID=A0A7E4WAP5_PANRE